MWLRLTYFDEAKTPIKINFDLVEAFQSDDGGTLVSVSTSSYRVSETMEEIERMLSFDPKDMLFSKPKLADDLNANEQRRKLPGQIDTWK